MSAVSILLIIIVSIGFLSVIAEDLIKVDKAKSTLFWGTLAWIVHFISATNSVLPISKLAVKYFKWNADLC